MGGRRLGVVAAACLLQVLPAMAQGPATRPADGLRLPTDRPRLLVGPDDLHALQRRCHTEYAETFARYLDQVRHTLHGPAGPGALYAPAFCHLVFGQSTQADEFTQYVADQLTRPEAWRLPSADMVVAADWCWEAFSRDARDAIQGHLQGLLAAIEPEQSPFDHLGLQGKICALGAAVVLHRAPELPKVGPANETVIAQAGLDYARTTLMTSLESRGVMTTGPSSGIWEEADACLLLEFLRSATGLPVWPDFRDTLGRACEHYFYAQADTGPLTSGWVHDDGTRIPLEPGTAAPGAVAALPFVLAARTGDPTACWYARRRARGIAAEDADPRDLDAFWAMALYDWSCETAADPEACPLARNLGGGWVVMRGSWQPDATLVLFDAGQPFWRSRQHFDAGQFQILRRGRLAIDSGDDVTFQASPGYRGDAYLGEQSGDWDQYFQATIAHNCVTVIDSRLHLQRFGRSWRAAGNQRLIEHDYRRFSEPIEKTDRVTGHLLAYETGADYCYAAADLSPAYELKTLLAYTREILFLHAGPVIVIDRVAAARSGQRVTWHLHFAQPPLIGGEPLREAWRLHGEGPAGTWQTAARGQWLRADDGQGSLYVQTLLPADALWTLIGGPAHEQRIVSGPHAGREYVGGQADGFEHWLLPAGVRGGVNAWYRLGAPADLGPQFGVGRSWGRLDVQPKEPRPQVLFVHLLWAQDRDGARQPKIQFDVAADQAELRTTLDGRAAAFRFALDGVGGEVTIGDKSYELTDRVQPQTPLPRENKP